MYAMDDFKMLFGGTGGIRADAFNEWLATNFLEVRESPVSGIWIRVDALEDHVLLHGSERDTYLEHPRNDVGLPVLPDPFTLREFLQLADWPGFYHSAARWPTDEAQARLDRLNPRSAALARSLASDSSPRERRARGTQTQQELKILDTLRVLGFDPTRLPKQRNGTAGVKAQAARAVEGTALFTTRKMFELAWDRLSREGAIAYADVTPPQLEGG